MEMVVNEGISLDELDSTGAVITTAPVSITDATLIIRGNSSLHGMDFSRSLTEVVTPAFTEAASFFTSGGVPAINKCDTPPFLVQHKGLIPQEAPYTYAFALGTW